MIKYRHMAYILSLPRWRDLPLARKLESNYPGLTSMFKQLSISKQNEFLLECRRELKHITLIMKLIETKRNGFLPQKVIVHGHKRVRRKKAPKEWLSHINLVIHKLRMKMNYINDFLKYLIWINTVTKVLSLYYIQYCNELGCNIAIDLLQITDYFSSK